MKFRPDDGGMKFQPSTSIASWCERRPAREQSEAALLGILEIHGVKRVLEVGPGSGARANAILQKFPNSDYSAFEPSPEHLRFARGAISIFAERASAEGRDLALPLPAASAGYDTALCLDLLEYLRMDQLYMVISELRRSSSPGGLCVLRTLSYAPGIGGRLAAFYRRHWPALARGARPLELNHYISPEDWRTLSDSRVRDGWLTRQTVVLERL